MERVIFHVDMDAFFASVEQRDNPQYRGKPVIVGARPGSRGVVSAASYEARIYGVHSAQPISQAYQRCPHGIFISPDGNKYRDVSEKIMDIFTTFTPVIEQISVDEAFLDMSGTERLFGEPLNAAEAIRQKIWKQLELTASIGIAPNKFLAKIASDMNKPNGVTEVPFDDDKIIEWLAPLEINKVWGIGKKTTQTLHGYNIYTVKDLQMLSYEILDQRFGKLGRGLYYLSRGIDNRKVNEGDHEAKSISREHTFGKDCYEEEEWKRVLLRLSRDVAYRARKSNEQGRTVALTYRTPDFRRYSRQLTLSEPTNIAKDIYEKAILLLSKERASLKALRLIGVGISGFDDAYSIDLLSPLTNKENWEKSEKSIDTLVSKFGKDVVFRGGEKRKS